MRTINKIIKVLSLTNSPRKEETVRNLIEYELYAIKISVTVKDLIKNIKDDFLLELSKDNIEDSLRKSIQDGKVYIEGGRYSLTNDRELELKNIYENEALKEVSRFERFSNLIDEIIEKPLDDAKKKYLVQIFTQYLYDRFYQYGEDVINQFIPAMNKENKLLEEDTILKRTLEKIDTLLMRKIFIKLIEKFPQKLSEEDLEYLQCLADKTECFLSLGLSQELYEEFVNLKIIDWTLFLDTNIIYCILGLDLEPESEASRKLVDIINKYSIQLKLRYFPHTLKELRKKKNYFENQITRTSFTSSQMHALIKSNQLDPYTKFYFEQKLKDVNYPHPVDTIDLAQQILSKKGILIYQTKLDELINEEHLTKEYEKFSSFIRNINAKTRNKKIEKSSDKIEHDILLREGVLNIRHNNAITLSDTKYFALTMDKVLLAYDQYQGRNPKTNILLPTFFSPTFLLQKLMNLLPVPTKDYKSAFISAISSQAFDTNHEKSVVVQRTVVYFHKLGIEDEGLILNCITDKYFLEEFENKEGTEEFNKFFQSEIDAYIKKLKKEKIKLEIDINQKNKKLEEIDELGKHQLNEFKVKDEKIRSLEETLKDSKLELEKLIKQMSELENEVINKNLVSSQVVTAATHIEPLPKSVLNKNVDKLIFINWKGFLNLLNKIALPFLIVMNIILTILLIITAIVSKSTHYLMLLPVSLGLVSDVFLKIKRYVNVMINVLILAILSFFIIINRDDIWNHWSKFFE